MKRWLKALVLAVLFFLAANIALGVGIGMILWAFVFGDTHEEFWALFPRLVAIASILLAGLFFYRDLASKSSPRGRIIRGSLSTVVLLTVLIGIIRGQIHTFKGWTSEEAVRNVAAMRFPEARDRFTLVEEEQRQVSSLTRGPYIVYLVKDGNEDIGRVGVTQHFGAWWTCGMSEFFK
ncbi:MAG: hypothetical protein H3C50_03280 [Kiritimatiellae bacterium]|nr:hypothetical protein [Kiritimatiellia bacterium]